jgi:hypothetical protein
VIDRSLGVAGDPGVPLPFKRHLDVLLADGDDRGGARRVWKREGQPVRLMRHVPRIEEPAR